MRKSTIYGLMSARAQREHGWSFLRNNDGGDDSGGGAGTDDTDDQGGDDGGTGDDDQDDKGSDDTPDDGKTPGGDKPKPASQPKPGKTYDEKYVKGLRGEAATARTQMKSLTDAILGVLDPEGRKAGEKLDPAQLTEQLTKTQLENRTLKIERALDKAARNHKADEDLLVAWLAHKGQLKDLDPASDDFASQLDELVAEAVKKNPKLKADTGPTPPARSGADFTGGGEKRADSAPQSIDDHRSLRRKRREVDLKP